MQFTGQELTAIIQTAKAVYMADGVFHQNERVVVTNELEAFGIKLNTEKSIVMEHLANNMEPSETFRILGNLTRDQKKYVLGFLTTIAMADGNIDEKEKKMLGLIAQLMKAPEFSIKECCEYYLNN